MNKIDKMRLEARHNDHISSLDREQARIERQMAELERKRQGVIQRINSELKRLHALQRLVVK